MIKESDIIKSIDSTLVSSDLSDVAIDMSENCIDSILNDGLLKDIPIVRSMVGIIKTTKSISNVLLLKKIIAFMRNLSGISTGMRQDMIFKLNSKRSYRESVGEQILFILDKCDSLTKADLQGVIFAQYVKGNIPPEKFMKIAQIINNNEISEILFFIRNITNECLEHIDYSPFVNMGVVTIHDTCTIRKVRPELMGVGLNVGKLYPWINENGQILKHILYDYLSR